MNRDGWLFAFLMVMAGTIGVLATESRLGSINIIFCRCFIATLALGVYCGWKGYLKRDIFKSGELRYIAVGGALLVINWVLIFRAFELAGITISIVSFYTEPFLLIFLGVVFLREAVKPSVVLWTLLAFIGLALLSLTGETSIFDSDSLLTGVAFAILAGSLYGSMTILSKKVKTTSPAVTVFIQMVIGTLMLLPLTDFSDAGDARWGYVIVLGLVHTSVLYLLFHRAVRGVPVGLIATLSFIDPVVSILSDVALYDVTLSPLQIVGIGMILVAAYVVSRPRPTKSEAEAESEPILAPS